MRLSIFTTSSTPARRGDNARDALACYRALADEVVVVVGGFGSLPSYGPSYKTVQRYWPREFSWNFIGQQFTRGYQIATGDVVIHADLDFIFHERDFEAIRAAAQKMLDEQMPAMSFYKYQFILPDRYNLKSRLVVMVNKRDYGDRIQFDAGGDKCQPSLDGKELHPDDVPEAKVPLYNYEKLLKTEDQIRDDVGRMARAWNTYFGEYKLGGPDDDSAYAEWVKMVKGRFAKPQEHIPITDHPKFVQETIKGLRPDQWGHSGFGELEENDYVRERT